MQNSCGIPDEELVILLASSPNTEGSGSSPP